jgi:hypothetical protein
MLVALFHRHFMVERGKEMLINNILNFTFFFFFCIFFIQEKISLSVTQNVVGNLMMSTFCYLILLDTCIYFI